MLIAILEALVVSWTLVFLAEYFGWHLVREAGGNTLQDNRKPEFTYSATKDCGSVYAWNPNTYELLTIHALRVRSARDSPNVELDLAKSESSLRIDLYDGHQTFPSLCTDLGPSPWEQPAAEARSWIALAGRVRIRYFYPAQGPGTTHVEITGLVLRSGDGRVATRRSIRFTAPSYGPRASLRS